MASVTLQLWYSHGYSASATWDPLQKYLVWRILIGKVLENIMCSSAKFHPARDATPSVSPGAGRIFGWLVLAQKSSAIPRRSSWYTLAAHTKKLAGNAGSSFLCRGKGQNPALLAHSKDPVQGTSAPKVTRERKLDALACPGWRRGTPQKGRGRLHGSLSSC